MKIDIYDLKKAGACERDIMIFKSLFGLECSTISLEDCRRAAENGLSLDWCARRFLPPKALERYLKQMEIIYEKYLEERTINKGTPIYKEIKKKWKKNINMIEAENFYLAMKSITEEKE